MSEIDNAQIDINVVTDYIAEQSDPTVDRYVFAYTITINNSGEIPAKLINQ